MNRPTIQLLGINMLNEHVCTLETRVYVLSGASQDCFARHFAVFKQYSLWIKY